MTRIRTTLTAAAFAFLAAAPVAAQAAKQAPADASGEWTLTSTTPRGERTSKLTLQQKGTDLTGSMEARMGEVAISNGSVKDGKVAFTLTMGRGDRTFSMVYEGSLKGDVIEGTYTNPRGDKIPFKATRGAPPASN